MSDLHYELMREGRKMWALAAATLERGISLDGLTDDERDVLIGAVLGAAENVAIDPLVEAAENLIELMFLHDLPVRVMKAMDALDTAIAKARGEA